MAMSWIRFIAPNTNDGNENKMPTTPIYTITMIYFVDKMKRKERRMKKKKKKK